MMKNDKKNVIILLLVILFIFGMSAYAYNEIIASKVDYNIYINGQLKEFSEPIIYEDTTYVSIREFAEMLGLNVGWNEYNKTINITGDFDMASVFNQLSKEELYFVMQFKDIKKGDTLQKLFNKVGHGTEGGSGILVLRYNVSEKVDVFVGSPDANTVWYVKIRINGEDYFLTD